MRVAKRVYVTRLPVGHSHEDIDSKFGIIWTRLRNMIILTPQDYIEQLRRVFGSSRLKFEAKPIFVVPDYVKLLTECLDPNFASYAKLEQTQLCWRFIAVPRDNDAPNGVETNYKRYAAEHSYEIIGDSSGVLIFYSIHVFNKRS